MAFQDKWFSAIRGSALIYITGFECVIVVANMMSISPSVLEKIAFAGIGVFVVLFKVQARVEGQLGLWFVGACLTFYMFMNFFLAICSIGLPLLAQGDTETVGTKQLAIEYEVQSKQYNKLIENQSSADYTMRTYMKDLAGPIADAKRAKEDAYRRLEDARTKDAILQKEKAEAFNGIRVFETAPRLLGAAILGGESKDLRADTRVGIAIAFLFGVAAGIFIEGVMVATVNRRRRDHGDTGVVVSKSGGDVPGVQVRDPVTEGWWDMVWPPESDFIYKLDVVLRDKEFSEDDLKRIKVWFEKEMRQYCGDEYRQGWKANVSRNKVRIMYG